MSVNAARRPRDASAGALLAFYKRVVSPALHAVAGAGGACRFQPTCSEYAAIAIAEHGLVRGTMMALGRLLRCHPLHRGGFDPVPAKHSGATSIRAGQVH
ncbi:MAG: membrane protein insertion efficiency factor YidD [Acidobacteriaceae bacterium]